MPKQKLIKILLIAAIILGIYLRLENLSKQSYWMDEGYTINATLSVAEKGKPILDSGEKYNCGLYCYPTALITKTFENNQWGYRILASIAGIFIILATYQLSFTLFKHNTAIIASVFVSLSYWQIAWSRQARWYTLFTLFFIFSISYFYKYIKEKKYSQLIISLVFALLSTITHRLGYLLPFIFLLMTVWIIYKKEENKKKKIIILILPILLTLGISEYFFGFQIFKGLFSYLHWGYGLPYYLSFYLREYHLFIFLAIFAFFEIKDKEKKYFLLGIILPYILILAIFSQTVNYRYFFHLTPLIYILAAFGVTQIIKNIKNKNFRLVFIIFIFILFFVSKNGILLAQNFYTLESDTGYKPNKPSTIYTPQPNFNKAYDVIEENIGKDEIIISAYPQFNKIFLQTPGYWIKYNYNGNQNSTPKIKNDIEYYVGAKVINDLSELQDTTNEKHGYIVFDLMSTQDRIAPEIINYIQSNMQQILYDEINQYSKIWVYQF